MYQFSKYLLSHTLFRILLAMYCLGNASIITMGSMINIIANNFGFSSSIGSIIAIFVIILGLSSSILYSIYFIRRSNQTIILAFYCCLCIIALLFAACCAISQ